MHDSLPLPETTGAKVRALLARLGFSPLSPAWKTSLAIFLAGRVFYSLWGALVWTSFTIPDHAWQFYRDIVPVVNGPAGALLGMWQRWDAIHYQRILMFGYEDNALTAFFPLYPLLARLVSTLTGAGPLLALTLVSSLAFLFALRVFYGVVEEAFSPKLAQQALVNLLLFPTSFFFLALSPLSLLLLLTLLSYGWARRGKWVEAGVANLIAGITHPLSLPLTFLLAWEALPVVFNRDILRQGQAGGQAAAPSTRLLHRIAAGLAPFTNLVSIGGYLLWRKAAGFSSYTSLQNENWGTGIHSLWEGISLIVQHMLQLQLTPDDFMDWVEVFFFVVICGLILLSLKKFPLKFSLGPFFYSAAVIGMFICTNHLERPLQNFLRYQVMIFPIYITLALIGQHSKVWQLFKFTLSILLIFLCATLFFMWVSYLT